MDVPDNNELATYILRYANTVLPDNLKQYRVFLPDNEAYLLFLKTFGIDSLTLLSNVEIMTAIANQHIYNFKPKIIRRVQVLTPFKGSKEDNKPFDDSDIPHTIDDIDISKTHLSQNGSVEISEINGVLSTVAVNELIKSISKQKLIQDNQENISEELRSALVAPVINASQYIQNYPQLPSNMLRDRLVQLAQIGKEKVYTIGNAVVKYLAYSPSDEEDEEKEDFDREIVVGLEINKLRDPGFMKTMGYNASTQCIIPGKEMYPLCDYLYLEKIEGVTLRHYLRYNNCSLLQFKTIMRHVVKTYHKAYYTIDFTHYDFHDSNIIINLSGLPVIIDFGTSHIRLPEGNIGDNYLGDGRYPDRSNWIHDFFKIMAFCALNTNMPIGSGINPKYQEEEDNKIESLIRSVEWEIPYHERSGYYTMSGTNDLLIFSRKRTYDAKGDVVIDIEPMSEYINRIRNMIGIQNFGFTYRIANRIYDIEMETLNLEEATDHNRIDLRDIHNYCINILMYFHPSMTTEWLLNYRKNVDPRFSSFMTDAGKLAKFEDFVSYFNQVSNT
jgi:hypothetical protein